MILKLCGCLFVLTSGTFGAFSLVKYQKTKLRVLDAWIDLIFFIRTQIDCYLMPIGEILQSAEPSLLSICACGKKAVSLSTLLQGAQRWLEPEAHRLLDSFIREIGSSYREEQVKRCDYYTERLSHVREKQMEALPSKTRGSAVLCICASLGVAILLW
jgi:hypothetical protein